MYSSPPRHGAEIAELVLSDPQLFQDWKVQRLASYMSPMSVALLAAACVLGQVIDHIVWHVAPPSG